MVCLSCLLVVILSFPCCRSSSTQPHTATRSCMHVKIMELDVEHSVVHRVIIGLEKNSFLIAAVGLVYYVSSLNSPTTFSPIRPMRL